MTKKIKNRLSSISTGFGVAGLLIFIGFVAIVIGAVRLGVIAKEIFNTYQSLPIDAAATTQDKLTQLLPLLTEANASNAINAMLWAIGLLWAGYLLKTLCVIAETQLIDLHSD